MAIEILQITHAWLDDQDFGRAMAAARETSRFGREATSVRALQEHQKNKTLNTYGKHVKRCIVGDEGWIWQKYALNKDSGFMIYQMHREAFLFAFQLNESDEEHLSIGLIHVNHGDQTKHGGRSHHETRGIKDAIDTS